MEAFRLADATIEPENSIAKKLFQAVQEVEEEVKKIEQEVARLNFQKTELLGLLRYSGKPTQATNVHVPKHVADKKQKQKEALPVVVKKRKGPAPGSISRRASPGEKTIPELIMEYMENNRKATAKEIRIYLDDLGRSTNPGVELGRLVKKNKIMLVDRGNYQLAK